MSRWNEAWPVAGPDWLVDAFGRVLGFRDKLGTDYQLSMQVISGGAETILPGALLAPGGAGSVFNAVTQGLVPASGGGTVNFLRADGSFAAPPVGPTYTVFGTGAVGLVPASGGGTTNFLRADGTFAAPAVGPTYSTFGSSTNGLVPAPGTVVGKVLSDAGTWVAQAAAATAYSALTDKASIDLTTVNNPLATALATINSNIAAKPSLQVGALAVSTTLAPNASAVKTYVDQSVQNLVSTPVPPVTTAFATAIPLDKIEGREPATIYAQTSDLVFTVAGSPAAVNNGNFTVTIAGDGTHNIDVTAFKAGNAWTLSKLNYNTLLFVQRPDAPYVFGVVGGVVPIIDNTAPTVVSVTALNATGGGVTLEVLFNSDLDQTQNAGSMYNAFAVSSGHPLTASAWGGTVRKLNLTTSTPFVNGESAKTLAFTQSGSIAIQHTGSTTKLATFSGQAITNLVAALPTITNVAVYNSAPGTIEVTLSEAYSGSLPAYTAFAVSTGHTLTAIAAGPSGTKFNLTTSTNFVKDEVVTLAYTEPGSNPITGVTSLQKLASVSGLTINNSVGYSVYDNFNRPDNSTSLGLASDGGSWTTTSGTAGILSGQAFSPSSFADAVRNMGHSATTITATITVGPANGFPCILLRGDGTTNNRYLIFFGLGSSGCKITEQVSGTQVDRVTGDMMQTQGVAFAATVVDNGSSIVVKVNGTTIISLTTSVMNTNTYTGFGIFNSGGVSDSIDNFGAT